MKRRHATVLCFGEILWDFLPDGLFPGGAPFNVAYHLHRHAIDVRIVSAIGRDLLGKELLRRLEQWQVPVQGITTTPQLPTGYVRATLGASGDAHYDIVKPVAWDHITPTPALLRTAAQARVLVYGSLAQRTTHNRVALKTLLRALPADALRIFDVNLRSPYDSLTRVAALAANADVLKLNSAEAARLAGGSDRPGREEKHARILATRHGCPLIVITAGARGAGLLRAGRWHWERGRPVDVVDTIGSGDAFLASLITGLLQPRPDDQKILARACRLGEWVAAQRGATPAYTRTTPA